MDRDTTSTPAPPPATRLMDLLWGYQRTQILHAAAELGLADILADGPLPVAELAARTGTQPDPLRRLLLALASHGLFAEDEEGRFALTPLAALLQTGVPGSLRAMVLAEGGDFYPVWGALLHSVRTGGTAFERVYGLTNWDYRARHPEVNARFNAYMGDLARQKVAAILANYTFPAEGLLIDVGGGDGTLLAGILGRYPGLRGVLFDLPHVVATATPLFASAGLDDRCEIGGGDFFAAVPPGGTRYILSTVLHDWRDERATAILGRCRVAMDAAARLLIIERVLPPDNSSPTGRLRDLHMLVNNVGGRERTEGEWRAVLAGSGFRLDRLTPTGPIFHVIEAAPV